MLNHGRHGAFAAAVVIALALIAPGTAMAGHDLVIYKVEKQVDLVSDQQDTTVSCASGDHALDGMWRIDHADQDDDVPFLTLMADPADVLQASATGPDDSEYTFRFEKIAIGKVQAKVWVTCLADETSGGAHNHSFNSAFDQTVPASYHSTTLAVPGGTAQTVDSSSFTCGAKKLLVSPGYDVTSVTNNNDSPADSEPEPGMNRLLESNLKTANNLRVWRWSFSNPAGLDSVITLTWRCLSIKVPTSVPAPDKHKLIAKYRANGSPAPQLAKQKISEVQLNCGDHYKAIVAGFRIDPTDYAFVYYLGMDPRIKQRAFRFLNIDGAATHPVTFNGICVNYRTT
jgi:hypothetical protein